CREHHVRHAARFVQNEIDDLPAEESSLRDGHERRQAVDEKLPVDQLYVEALRGVRILWKAKIVRSYVLLENLRRDLARVRRRERGGRARVVRTILLVFEAHVFEQVGVRQKVSVDSDGKWLREGLGIRHRLLDFEAAEASPPESFRQPEVFRMRM